MHRKKQLHMQRRNPDRIKVMNKQKRVRQWLARVEDAPDNVVKLDYIERKRYRQQGSQIMRPMFTPQTFEAVA